MLMLDYLFVYSHMRNLFSYLAVVTITSDRAANKDPCFALMAFFSEGSFTYHA
jgi:hypothetical protein